MEKRVEKYNTLVKASEGEYREKGSKFFARAFPASTTSEVQEYLELIRKEHPKARHHCYAYRLDIYGKEYRANDDGEPSGTAGKPILGQIDSKELSKVFIVVTRYFGGKKLGASGLIHAYRTAAQAALDAGEIKEVQIQAEYSLIFDTQRLNDIMRAIRHDQVKIKGQFFTEKYQIDIAVDLSCEAQIITALKKIYDLEIITY